MIIRNGTNFVCTNDGPICVDDPGKQIGAIRFGGGLDERNKMEEMSGRGYLVVDCGDHATLHADPTACGAPA